MPVTLLVDYDCPFREVAVSQPFLYEGQFCWKINDRQYMRRGSTESHRMELQTMVTPFED